MAVQLFSDVNRIKILNVCGLCVKSIYKLGMRRGDGAMDSMA